MAKKQNKNDYSELSNNQLLKKCTEAIKDITKVTTEENLDIESTYDKPLIEEKRTVENLKKEILKRMK